MQPRFTNSRIVRQPRDFSARSVLFIANAAHPRASNSALTGSGVDPAGVNIDTGVYDKVRAFRAPNSRHPKTGRHKRRVSVDELMHFSADTILNLAEHPEPFDIPAPTGQSEQAAADWVEAAQCVERGAEANRQRPAVNGSPALNRQTFDSMCNGAAVGDRHRRLFSAAANLAEFDCPPALAHALLTEAGLDSGLPPSGVRRQIECGLNGAESPEVQP